MAGTPWFTPGDAQREVERVVRHANAVIWKSPTGQLFNLDLPLSVYPPREDTDLLAGVLQRCRLPPGSSCLEIGCGSGALSLFVSSLGWRVVSCDVNPLAVAAARGHALRYGLKVDVREGGPGPSVDGFPSQWGGDQTYRLVLWNMPYLRPPDDMNEAHLGPLEEAALTDTDNVGLFPRFVERLSSTHLLSRDGVALVVLSSAGGLDRAQSTAWRAGLAAKEVAFHEFEDGERVGVLALWHPFSEAARIRLETISSTNTSLLLGDQPPGTSMRTDEQTHGRGRHAHTWSSSPDSLEMSWVLDDGPNVEHHPLHQVVFGSAIVRYLNQCTGAEDHPFCLKWPNDVYVRRSKDGWVKCGGILYEMASKGQRHRLVVGLGLNATGSPGSAFGTLNDGGLHVSVQQLAEEVDAIVCSLHDAPPFLFLEDIDRFEDVAATFLRGVELLGPLVLDGHAVKDPALQPSGWLSVSVGGRREDLEDSVGLVWLGLQNGVENN